MKRMRAFLAATLAILAAGCGSESTSSGKLTLLLKDAPAPDVQAAVVTIAEVTLVGDAGQIVLRDTPVTTNLLTLANDVMSLVQGATVPAGTYGQLRFVITGGYLDVAGAIYASSPDYEGLPPGAVVAGELQMPSYPRSGLKVILPDGGLVVGEDSTWVVDFDVSQSFGHDTGTDKWVMHPVVKGTSIEQNGAVTVSAWLGGEAFLPEGLSLESFSASLAPVAGGDVKTLPLVERGDGTAAVTFQYLPAGDYAVSIVGPEGVTLSVNPEMPATVTVSGGATTGIDFELTSIDVLAPPQM